MPKGRCKQAWKADVKGAVGSRGRGLGSAGGWGVSHSGSHAPVMGSSWAPEGSVMGGPSIRMMGQQRGSAGRVRQGRSRRGFTAVEEGIFFCGLLACLPSSSPCQPAAAAATCCLPKGLAGSAAAAGLGGRPCTPFLPLPCLPRSPGPAKVARGGQGHSKGVRPCRASKAGALCGDLHAADHLPWPFLP